KPRDAVLRLVDRAGGGGVSVPGDEHPARGFQQFPGVQALDVEAALLKASGRSARRDDSTPEGSPSAGQRTLLQCVCLDGSFVPAQAKALFAALPSGGRRMWKRRAETGDNLAVIVINRPPPRKGDQTSKALGERQPPACSREYEHEHEHEREC